MKNLPGRLDQVEPLAQQRAVRIAEDQGKVLAEVIRRSLGGMLAETVNLLESEGNAEVAARVRQEWPQWMGRIVPAEIDAVTMAQPTPGT